MERRHVSSRSSSAIQRCAQLLGRTPITPNQISCFSVVAALGVPVGLFGIQGAAGVLLALAGVQLRLLANVLDGLVAVEGGKSSAVGALYNDIPDRVTDTVILVSLGWAAGLPDLGWLCAGLALATAYIRMLGGALGLEQSFRGPMAKQHRMAVVNVMLGAMLMSATAGWPGSQSTQAILTTGMVVLALGTAWTCASRTRAIARALQARTADETRRAP